MYAKRNANGRKLLIHNHQNMGIEVKLEVGIFNYLRNLGYNIHEQRKVLHSYAITMGISRPKKQRTQWYSAISFKAQEDFDSFKKFFNRNYHRKMCKKDQYQKWYDRCNSDGSFAYNGVADDF